MMFFPPRWIAAFGGIRAGEECESDAEGGDWKRPVGVTVEARMEFGRGTCHFYILIVVVW